jgi:hypothetical protein
MLLRESSTFHVRQTSYKEIEIRSQKNKEQGQKQQHEEAPIPLVMLDRSVAYSSLIGPRKPIFGGPSSLSSNVASYGEIGRPVMISRRGTGSPDEIHIYN